MRIADGNTFNWPTGQKQAILRTVLICVFEPYPTTSPARGWSLWKAQIEPASCCSRQDAGSTSKDYARSYKEKDDD